VNTYKPKCFSGVAPHAKTSVSY